MELTIIIPVHNGEKTIKRAIDSVMPVLENNRELLIVNDGSNDGTENIIQEYLLAQKGKISYYKKEKEGVAAARNFGITHAKGDYIMFVDADDYIDTNLLKNMQIYIEQGIDIIKFKIKHVNEQRKEIASIDGPIFSVITGEEAFNQLAFSDVLMDSPCCYVFKKDLFLKNQLFFKMGTYHEDFGLIPLILVNAKSVVSTNTYGYYYVQTEKSITRNNDYEKTKKKWTDCLLHYDTMLQLIKKFDICEKTKENIKIYYTNAVLLKLKSIHKEDRKEYIHEIKKRKMIKNIKSKNGKQLLKRILLSININWYLEWTSKQA